MKEIFDITVVGSGFAGSLLSMIAAKLGYSVLLLERGSHPRFTIGESSTPLCNLLLEELATHYDLPALKPLTKWGSWQREYPEVSCGLKRGFSFFHHDLYDPTNGPIEIERQMLVAASPHDEIADTHWFRADFDAKLVSLAQELGVTYLDQVSLAKLTEFDDFVELSGERNEHQVKYESRFLVDATGPRGCLHHLLNLSGKTFEDYPRTQALFSHFSGVQRLEHCARNGEGETASYPIDDSAVHHVFDGGWIWVLQFNNGITSAGVAATELTGKRLGLERGAAAWAELIMNIPTLQEQFLGSTPVQAFTFVPSLSSSSVQIIGNRWAMLPSAAGFIDPLLSTGFPLALLGIKRMAALLEKGCNILERIPGLEGYALETNAELEQTARLIGAMYANMGNFSAFRALSLLYFASASYSETVKRLGKPELASSFLLYDNPAFGPACKQLFARAERGISKYETQSFIQDVMAVIEPFDVAGLTRRETSHRYPVVAEDLLAAAEKVNSNRDEIARMLALSGFYAPVLA